MLFNAAFSTQHKSNHSPLSYYLSSYLPPKDIYHLGQTCKTGQRNFLSNGNWKQVVQRDFGFNFDLLPQKIAAQYKAIKKIDVFFQNHSLFFGFILNTSKNCMFYFEKPETPFFILLKERGTVKILGEYLSGVGAYDGITEFDLSERGFPLLNWLGADETDREAQKLEFIAAAGNKFQANEGFYLTKKGKIYIGVHSDPWRTKKIPLEHETTYLNFRSIHSETSDALFAVTHDGELYHFDLSPLANFNANKDEAFPHIPVTRIFLHSKQMPIEIKEFTLFTDKYDNCYFIIQTLEDKLFTAVFEEGDSLEAKHLADHIKETGINLYKLGSFYFLTQKGELYYAKISPGGEVKKERIPPSKETAVFLKIFPGGTPDFPSHIELDLATGASSMEEVYESLY